MSYLEMIIGSIILLLGLLLIVVMRKKIDLDGKVIVLMGASGAGKTSVGQHLKKMGIPEVISHTTREPRKGEIPNESYYFVNKRKFNKLDKIEEIEYTGNHYCISRKEIQHRLKTSKVSFVICDVNGMEQIKGNYPHQTTVINIRIPLEEMETRMRARGDDEEKIQTRLTHAIETGELNLEKHADYVVENVKLEDTVDSVLAIIKQITDR